MPFNLSNLLQEGIEGIRRRRYYYHENITPMDGEEALSVLPSDIRDSLMGMVLGWVSIMDVPSRNPRYVSVLVSRFLSTIAAELSKRLEDTFGIQMGIEVRTSQVQQLAASKFEVSSAGRGALLRLHQEWVLRPFLRRAKGLDREAVVHLCDDTVGLLRSVAGVVLKTVSDRLGISMEVRLRYPFEDVKVDVKRTRFYRRPRSEKRVGKQVAAVYNDTRPPLVSLNDFPTIGKDWAP